MKQIRIKQDHVGLRQSMIPNWGSWARRDCRLTVPANAKRLKNRVGVKTPTDIDSRIAHYQALARDGLPFVPPLGSGVQ